MYRVDKPKPLGLGRVLPRIRRVAQQPRRHARPKGEDDKREQIAHGHGPPPPLKHRRPERRGVIPPVAVQRHHRGLLLTVGRRRLPVQPVARAGRRDVVQHDEVQDGAGDVDERVRLVGPAHQGRVGEEPALHGRLDEEAQPLLGVDHLHRVLARRLDCRGLQGDGCEGASELVDLRGEGVSV